MITIFTTPKPFKGKIDIIQRNAILSWKNLHPLCEIILFGKDEGVSEIANELNLKHVSKINCNKWGTQLVNSIFETAQKISGHGLMAYVNADIMLTSDFIQAIQRITKHPFLAIGQRYDLDIDYLVDFYNPSYKKKINFLINKSCILHGKTGIDYFIFSRGRVYWLFYI